MTSVDNIGCRNLTTLRVLCGSRFLQTLNRPYPLFPTSPARRSSPRPCFRICHKHEPRRRAPAPHLSRSRLQLSSRTLPFSRPRAGRPAPRISNLQHQSRIQHDESLRTRLRPGSGCEFDHPPARTPNKRRTSRGTVICPLLVMVACFCMDFLTLPHFPYFR